MKMRSLFSLSDLLQTLLRSYALLPLAAAALAADGNRLAYLDDKSPFWPTPKSPRFITPQWVGEPGVDAVVVLAIDDMRDTAKYETFLRPILDRLKQIDGRAPVSIMTNNVDPADPQLAKWLAEGLSLEVHTLTHPCPCLGKSTFDESKRTFFDCIDLLAKIPGNKPVAFRMPCCDSMNSASPRFYAEIFPGRSEAGNGLSIDSSVFMRPPGARFERYFVQELRPPSKVSLRDYAGWIEDYPYPYVIGNRAWEFPCMVPSDWEAFNAQGPQSEQVLDDWKAGLDYVVEKQGVFTAVFHPHGWSSPAQWVEFIDFAQQKYGKRVKFLNFREALERLEKHALGGGSMRTADGRSAGTRVLDLNNDGFMDIVGTSRNITRVWDPKRQAWTENGSFAVFGDGPLSPRFGIIEEDGAVSAIMFQYMSMGMTFRDGKWALAPHLHGPEAYAEDVYMPGYSKLGVQGDLMLRDFDNDGSCEMLIGNDKESAILSWDPKVRKWKKADFALPPGIAVARRMDSDKLIFSQWGDSGLRFVDLNGDGYDDVFQSNESGHAIYLWAGKVRADLGWTRGWPHKVSVLDKVPERLASDSIAPFAKSGANNGAWFHRGHVVWQNEDTAHLDAVTLRRSFADVIAVPMPPQKTPEESQKAFVTRAGFTVELVAAEPLIESPVAFDWDANGRLWVVEMRDYPNGMDGKGEHGGRIKVLTDEDGDGRYDKATLFADGIPFPTGLHPWRDGVIVAAVPDIAFYRATDGDDESDERTVLFTGFKPGNQQHRMNGFEWGLDGWLYGANGDSGGTVVPSHGEKRHPVSISGRDFRFRPDGSAFEAESGQTQYGRRRDDWGNWFGNNNPTWLWHYTSEDRYLRRNPKLAVKSVRRVTNGDTRVFTAYALADAPTRLNQPQSLGHVTSANSPTPYRDELFGPEFATSVFISEPVHNVVHREVLVPEGATFTSKRADGEAEQEFLASRDVWFRPTMLKTGPDGALYIADMYRFVLEHPEWIAPETQSRMDLRAGADKGRIWRVYPTGSKLRKIPKLQDLPDDKLAAAMDSPNGWQRDTVQRILLEKYSIRMITDSVFPILRDLATRSENPKVRAHCIATLGTLNSFSVDDLRPALRDKHPQVRVQAIRAAERIAQPAPAVFNALLICMDDPEFIVRRQLALTLGEFFSQSGDKHAVLARLAERDGDNEQMRIAIMSSLGPEDALFKKLNSSPAATTKVPELPKPTTPDRAKVIAGYAEVTKLKSDAARGRAIFQQSCVLCHRFKGEGNEVGPDLAMTSTKPDEWMLAGIFDPNAAVEPRYAAQLVKMKSGAELAGIISSETANNITLRLPGGSEQAILRTDIDTMTASGRSLMPESLEAALKPQDVADLLAWLRSK